MKYKHFKQALLFKVGSSIELRRQFLYLSSMVTFLHRLQNAIGCRAKFLLFLYTNSSLIIQ